MTWSNIKGSWENIPQIFRVIRGSFKRSTRNPARRVETVQVDLVEENEIVDEGQAVTDSLRKSQVVTRNGVVNET